MGFDEEAGECLLTAAVTARRPCPGVVSLFDSQICLRGGVHGAMYVWGAGGRQIASQADHETEAGFVWRL